ncbi:Holliday junction branch migration DNA helicase RuvB [Candidatus Saccharibacteria bacterium]|nr:Holliday junction branch migration DNA helicase RuvB [Candidatus Saccharibacteria bacterium]
MAIKRLLDKSAQPADLEEEISLRPRNFDEYVGQKRLKTNLQLAIAAAKKRREPLDHILLYGPAGLGKTTMATVIAAEMGVPMRTTSGPAIVRAADLASLITNLKAGDILFIDEIHRLNRAVEEILYSVMEDFKLDISLGKGAGAKSLRLDLPPFTLIAATTRTGSLSAPLRDRFGHIHRLEFYTVEEIAKIIRRSADILKTKITPEAAQTLAGRSRLTPRIANRLLRRVRDYSDIKADGLITETEAEAALEMLAIDNLGLDAADRLLLSLIIDNHGGGPVGLSTLAAMLGDESQTIEDYFEPFLLQIGLLERTPRGRCTTPKAKSHLTSLDGRQSA